MNRTDIINKLLGMPCYLIDILPEQVEAENGGQYFAAEQYFLKKRELKKFCSRISAILLKLNCYYFFEVSAHGKWKENPKPEKLTELIEKCILDKKFPVHILVGKKDAFIQLDTDNLYVGIYNADEKMKSIISQLTDSEGLFFRQAE